MGHGFLSDREIIQHKKELFRDPIDNSRAMGASFDLSLGDEVYLSGKEYPEILSKEQPFVSIPRGQFALLISKEYVKMPKDCLGFISIKFGVKAKGLINVSGFHVDPGRDGKIIFSVFNAGPTDVVLKYGDPVFMIFFYRLEDEVANPYNGTLKETEHLPVEIVTSVKGTSASLADVDKRVRDLEVTTKIFIGLFAALAAGLVAILIKVITG